MKRTTKEATHGAADGSAERASNRDGQVMFTVLDDARYIPSTRVGSNRLFGFSGPRPASMRSAFVSKAVSSTKVMAEPLLTTSPLRIRASGSAKQIETRNRRNIYWFIFVE